MKSSWLVMLTQAAAAWAQDRVGRYGRYTASFETSKAYGNPYVEVTAEAGLTPPMEPRPRFFVGIPEVVFSTR